MCYLPKATFYFYFGFFFLGYIWVFGIFFYNAWGNGGERKIAKSLPLNPPPGRPLLGNDVELLYFDLKTPFENPVSEKFCVTLRSEPVFAICTHNPRKDGGISAHISQNKEWEPELAGLIRKALLEDPGAIFVDIGANIGYYSLLAAKFGHKVLAVEPFSDNLLLLKQSALLNKLENEIIAVQTAVSDQQRNLTMVFDSENYGNRFVISSDEMRFKTRNRNSTHVEAITIDDLLHSSLLRETKESHNADQDLSRRPKSRIIMKVDIQGHECHAFRSAKNFLQKFLVSPIFMEWSEMQKLGDQKCISSLVRTLTLAGYKPYRVDGNALKLRDLAGGDLTISQDIVWKKIK